MINIIGHTSYLGSTGYNSHSQNFFTNINKYYPVRIRNYSYDPDLSKYSKEILDMIIEQNWNTSPYKIGTPFHKNSNDTYINIVLNETHHYYFYDGYESPMIAYNVWESTRQPKEFFDRILQFDQFWCPTQWQKQCTIEQGYPEDRVKVVPEGVNSNIFKPGFDNNIRKSLLNKYNIPENSFIFMIFGRWDYRKSIKEMIECWINKFKYIDNCYLVISADNPFSVDGLNSTEERLEKYNLKNDRIRILHFPPRYEYIQWLQYGSCLLSCSRSEGWNLPLLECISCGTPSICSDWGGHLEFAKDVSIKVNVPKELKPKNVFNIDDKNDLGVWGEPDFDHLEDIMMYVFNNYGTCKQDVLRKFESIVNKYSWENSVLIAKKYIDEIVKFSI